MWENTVAIHSVLKEKKLQSKIFNQCKKRRRNALWITVVLHSGLGVGEQ
jgi:hypothetical protein